MEKTNGEKIVMTDGSPYNSLLKRGSTLFKAKCHRGHEVTYVEIDLEEYDRRVDELAKDIAKQPGIDLLAILKDALYDLPLDYLKSIESKVKKELEKPKPEIKTGELNDKGTGDREETLPSLFVSDRGVHPDTG